jgi:hypothetical protein
VVDVRNDAKIPNLALVYHNWKLLSGRFAAAQPLVEVGYRSLEPRLKVNFWGPAQLALRKRDVRLAASGVVLR